MVENKYLVNNKSSTQYFVTNFVGYDRGQTFKSSPGLHTLFLFYLFFTLVFWDIFTYFLSLNLKFIHLHEWMSFLRTQNSELSSNLIKQHCLTLSTWKI